MSHEKIFIGNEPFEQRLNPINTQKRAPAFKGRLVGLLWQDVMSGRQLHLDGATVKLKEACNDPK